MRQVSVCVRGTGLVRPPVVLLLVAATDRSIRACSDAQRLRDTPGAYRLLESSSKTKLHFFTNVIERCRPRPKLTRGVDWKLERVAKELSHRAHAKQKFCLAHILVALLHKVGHAPAALVPMGQRGKGGIGVHVAAAFGLKALSACWILVHGLFVPGVVALFDLLGGRGLAKISDIYLHTATTCAVSCYIFGGAIVDGLGEVNLEIRNSRGFVKMGRFLSLVILRRCSSSGGSRWPGLASGLGGSFQGDDSWRLLGRSREEGHVVLKRSDVPGFCSEQEVGGVVLRSQWCSRLYIGRSIRGASPRHCNFNELTLRNKMFTVFYNSDWDCQVFCNVLDGVRCCQ